MASSNVARCIPRSCHGHCTRSQSQATDEAVEAPRALADRITDQLTKGMRSGNAPCRAASEGSGYRACTWHARSDQISGVCVVASASAARVSGGCGAFQFHCSSASRSQRRRVTGSRSSTSCRYASGCTPFSFAVYAAHGTMPSELVFPRIFSSRHVIGSA